MKFGRLSDVKDVDFQLPGLSDALLGWEESKTTVVEQSDFKLYVGAPVWSHKGFFGKIYPPKLKANEFLSWYARNFNCIELNSTFYGLPREGVIARWTEQVGSGFRFCPKVPRSITHESSGIPRQQVADFFRATELFGDNLGMSFFQFPPELGPRQWRRLKDILELIPKGMEVAVELRHPEWFASHKAQAWLCKLGVESGVTFVISDTAGRRDVLHFCLPQQQGFVRFSGDALVASDFSRLDVWVEAIEAFRERGLRGSYFFLHQEEEGNCVELAEYLAGKMPEAPLPAIERVVVQEQLALF